VSLFLSDGHPQVVDDGQAREDAAPLRDVRQPELPDAMGRLSGDVLSVEDDPPAVGGTNPETARASVLLPAPLAPNTASTVPGSTVRDTPKSARDDP
jgi:hypothetical protein